MRASNKDQLNQQQTKCASFKSFIVSNYNCTRSLFGTLLKRINVEYHFHISTSLSNTMTNIQPKEFYQQICRVWFRKQRPMEATRKDTSYFLSLPPNDRNDPSVQLLNEFVSNVKHYRNLVSGKSRGF
jgi:hypothetical protein